MLTNLRSLSKCRRSGFTLIEVIVAATIMTMVTTGAITVFIMGLKAYHAESIKNELNLDLEIAMENMRQDLRLSSACLGGAMAFYPADSNVFTAISFPIASIDADGLLARDTNTVARKVTWDQTVIYHVRKGEPDQLVRTVFQRDPTVTEVPTPDQLYNQLVDVVKNHSTTNAEFPGETWRSRVIFNNLVDVSFRALPCYFDGWTTNAGREGSFNFGSIVIGPGHHWVELELVATNRNATNTWIGIDKLQLSPSGSDREGEFYAMTNEYGMNFGYFTMSNTPGTTVQIDDMSHVMGYNWSNKKQLTFKPNKAGDRIGFNVYNDMWLDTDFGNYGGGKYGNRAEVISNSYVSATKGITWAALQIGTITTTNYWQGQEGTNYGVNVVGETYGGIPALSLIRYSGKRCRIQFAGPSAGFVGTALVMDNVKFEDDTGSNTYAVTFEEAHLANALVTAVAPAYERVGIQAGAGPVWSDWIDKEIEVEKSYTITWDGGIAGNSNSCYVGYWPTSIDNISWYGTNGVTTILAVAAIEVTYPPVAGFQSGIFDTGVTNPAYTTMKCRAIERNDSGGDYNDVGGKAIGELHVKVGSANDPTMVGGADWLTDHAAAFIYNLSTVTFFEFKPAPGTPNQDDYDISALAPSRYVQYGARFDSGPDVPASPADYMYSAELLDVLIEWPAPTGAVDLTMSLARGPDYGGIYKAYVDGQELVKGLKVEMQIFNTSIPLGREYTVKGELHVIPLNTGK
ncbi:PilW family protein [Verrucomicrobiota bacterium]